MDVSPFAQYYLRKLLSETATDWQSSASQFSESIAPYGTDLSQVLTTFTARSTTNAPMIRELESLIQMYQILADRLMQESNRLEEVRRRIWRLLDLQSSAIATCRLPSILEEDSITPFCFYYNNRIQLGMRYNRQLYGMVQQLPEHAKLTADQLIWLLMNQQIAAVLTVSSECYRLWIDLRSPTYRTLIQQGSEVLQVALSLQALMTAHKQQPIQKLRS